MDQKKRRPSESGGEALTTPRNPSLAIGGSDFHGVVATGNGLSFQGNVSTGSGPVTINNIIKDPRHERTDVLQWLSVVDPSTSHEAARRKRQPTTGEWFIGGEDFYRWKGDSNSFLWLYGIPCKAGCGKTVLCSSIIEDVKLFCGTRSGIALAYFYFDFNDFDKRTVASLLCSLIAQLSVRAAEFPNPVQNLYDLHNDRGNKTRPTDDQLTKLLQAVLESFSCTYIIVDALDECVEREELLALLVEMAGWRNSPNLLMAARQEWEIELVLKPLSKSICLHSSKVDPDIRTYVYSRMSNDLVFKRWPEFARKRIEISLTGRAKGMFRLVACQLDILRKCKLPKHLTKTLESLPKTLDDMYDRILLSIDVEFRGKAHKALQWLAFSTRPLKLIELAEAVIVEPGCGSVGPEDRLLDPYDILTICSSLVSLTDVGFVKLAHYSVKEYLISDRIRKGPASSFRVLCTPAHRVIAETCITYLLLFTQAIGPADQGFRGFPLLEYATAHWHIHVQLVPQDTPLAVLVAQLFNSGGASKCMGGHSSLSHWPFMYDGLSGPPLFPVAYFGLLGVTKVLLESGASVDARMDGMTALHAAALEGHEEVVRLLVDNGADIHAKDRNDRTALHWVAERGYEEIARLLLERGADINGWCEFGKAVLHMAARGTHEALVRLLVKKGANVAAVDEFGYTALHFAADRGHVAVVELLVESGTSLNARNEIGKTALHLAAERGHEAVVRVLAERGAHLDARDREGKTALHLAVEESYERVVRSLVEKGANLRMSDKYRRTALHQAAEVGEQALVRLFVEKGLSVNAKDVTGRRAIHLGAESGPQSEDIVRFLLGSGAKFDAENRHGRAVLRDCECSRVVQLLEEAAGRQSEYATRGALVRRDEHRLSTE